MTKLNNQKQIQELLTRGVENIYPNREFLEKKLQTGEQLKLYLGIDPTGANLHLGHAIVLRKLSQFQKLGHKIILLIGNFTAMCGDPDKDSSRTRLTSEQVMENCDGYKKQLAKFLDFNGDNPVEMKFNADWLGKMNFTDLIEIASHFTVQQIIARDLFQRRIEKGNPIQLHEFFYPLMQAYDSVAMDVDGEIGGNDQTFNMLAGRDLMKSMKNKEKFILTMKLLEDNSGAKMGKTTGNMIVMNESPNEIFGKVMSWSDGLIVHGFELLTDVDLNEIEKIKTEMNSGKLNPRDAKAKLAKKLVEIFYDKKKAEQAESEFNKIFQQKQKPTKISKFIVMAIEYPIVELLILTELVFSKGEAKRMIKQGGVKIDDKKIEDINAKIPAENGMVIQVGKRKFAELEIVKK